LGHNAHTFKANIPCVKQNAAAWKHRGLALKANAALIPL